MIPLLIWARRVRRIDVCKSGIISDNKGYEFSDEQREKNEKRNEFKHWAFIIAIIFACLVVVVTVYDLIIYLRFYDADKNNFNKLPFSQGSQFPLFVMFLTFILVWAGMVGRLPDKRIRDPYDYGHDSFNYLDENDELIKCSKRKKKNINP